MILKSHEQVMLNGHKNTDFSISFVGNAEQEHVSEH